jgi:hypothetical protein
VANIKEETFSYRKFNLKKRKSKVKTLPVHSIENVLFPTLETLIQQDIFVVSEYCIITI